MWQWAADLQSQLQSQLRWTSARTARMIVLVCAVLLPGACNEQAEEELKGKIGPGEGGPAVSDTPSEHFVRNSASQIIGLYRYDDSFFLHDHPDPDNESLHVLATLTLVEIIVDLADDGELNGLTGSDTVIFITRIIGRPDTPCRFQAAVQARDEGFEILASGDRSNDQNLDFHQVNLSKGTIHQRFYCTKLRQNLGVAFNVFTAAAEVQEYLQVHSLLNSVALP